MPTAQTHFNLLEPAALSISTCVCDCPFTTNGGFFLPKSLPHTFLFSHHPSSGKAFLSRSSSDPHHPAGACITPHHSPPHVGLPSD
eukprot:731444-Pelagomonas_calceolata.AAC.6